jgi:hypothetical protein
MSTENVDRVRAAIDALNGSGWDPDAVIPHFDPGAVHYPFPDWPGLDRYSTMAAPAARAYRPRPR